MSIEQLPARGFGPQASISGIVTAGFSNNASPTPSLVTSTNQNGNTILTIVGVG